MLFTKRKIATVLLLSSLVLVQGQVLAEETTSEMDASTQVTAVSNFNPSEFRVGNYSSLIGTWQDGLGGQIAITKEGHLYSRGANGGYLSLAGLKLDADGRLFFKLTSQPDGNTEASLYLELLPAGQALAGVTDTSDQTKDRLLFSHSNNDPQAIYYKVSSSFFWEIETPATENTGTPVSLDKAINKEEEIQLPKPNQDNQEVPVASENQPDNQETEQTSETGQAQSEEVNQPAMETEDSPKDSASMVKEDSQPVGTEVAEPSASPTTESSSPSQADETKPSSTVKGTTTDSTDKATNSNSQAPAKQKKATGVAGAGQSNQTKSIQKSGQPAQSTNGAATSQKTKATTKSLPKTGDQSSGLFVTLVGLLLGLLALGRKSLSSRD